MKRYAFAFVAGIAVTMLLGAAVSPVSPIKLLINGLDYGDEPQNAARIIDGQTFIPIRLLQRSLGEDVVWNSKTRTVTIRPDVFKGGFGSNAEEWPRVRNAIQKYLIAVEEKDPKAADYYTAKGVSTWLDSEQGHSFLNVSFVDGMKLNDGKSYVVRVSILLSNMIWGRPAQAVFDIYVDASTLLITKVEEAPGGEVFKYTEYLVLPGVPVRFPMEG